MRVAIVGTGFSGVAAACQLLRRLPAGSELTLFNASGAWARGLAYGTRSDEHVLNVPAARMSLYPDRPLHFLDWLRAGDERYAGADFVSRRLYGLYLQHCLDEAVRECPQVQLLTQVAHVEHLHPLAIGGYLLSWRSAAAEGGAGRLQSGEFARVVVALGHFAPPAPLPALAELPGAHYANDPWDPQALAGLPDDAPLALIGSGLTMLDVLLSLRRRGHRGRVLALSRRGLAPLGHRANELPPPDWVLSAALLEPGLGLRQRLRRLREEVRAAAAAGCDWRDVFAALRPHTSALWQQLSMRDRARFLRHLQVYWDVHRHRAAPAAIEELAALQSSGQVERRAGRLSAVDLSPQGRLTLHWTPRGSDALQRFEAQRVINCSGPSARVSARSSALLWQLQQQGLLQVCPLGLGLHVDGQYRLLDADGRAQPGLFYIGPLLKAQHWEATAVPELRLVAQRLAEALCATPT